MKVAGKFSINNATSIFGDMIIFEIFIFWNKMEPFMLISSFLNKICHLLFSLTLSHEHRPSAEDLADAGSKNSGEGPKKGYFAATCSDASASGSFNCDSGVSEFMALAIRQV